MSINGKTIRESPETLGALFNASVTYSVPPYQRAYSWEEKHINQFLEDLREHPSTKPYYLGHFLFEQGSSSELFVIDGQQRLSTVVLFIGCICRHLTAYGKNAEADKLYGQFLERDGKFRFCTVKDDLDLFIDLAKSGRSSTEAVSRSQKRIHSAYNLLFKHLGKLDVNSAISLASVLGQSHVTRFVVADKVQATQIFTLQNSRGKDLNELEKLKAYLMYQVYLHSSENEENRAITTIERQFETIYETAERIHYLTDDQVLRHHDQAYSPHWAGPLENLKKDLTKIGQPPAKVSYITEYCKALASTFLHVEKLEKLISHHEEVADLIILDAPKSWPLLIKLYSHHGDKLVYDQALLELLKNTEITLFKFSFLHGKFINDLPKYAKELEADEPALDILKDRLRNAAKDGFRPRGSFSESLLNHLRGDYHYHLSSRYILWKYENKTRHPKDHEVSPGEYLNINKVKNNMDATIEHIAPQTPQGKPHAEEFTKRFLNNLGNLLFMPKGLNSSQGNRPPENKANDLANVSYASHREVANHIRTPCEEIDCKDAWCEHKILARKQKIVEFAIERWCAA